MLSLVFMKMHHTLENLHIRQFKNIFHRISQTYSNLFFIRSTSLFVESSTTKPQLTGITDEKRMPL